MTDEQRQEIMRRMNEGMCAMSDAQMAVRAAEQADGMRNAWPDGIDYAKGQADMTNFWREATDATPIAQLPPKPPPTLWARFKRWIRA
jgi:hypothetical protein